MSDETVGYVADPSHLDRFLPRVIKNGERNPFRKTDMKRVLDFDNVPDPPTGGAVMYCEDGGPEGLKFHVRHMVLRGGFLFYYDVQDVYEEAGDVEYLDEPLGVLPLNKVGVEFPPGGRRVFREHAHTDARNGYELVVYHAPDDSDNEETRPPAFLVLESLAQREKWCAALKARAEIDEPTKLRMVFETRFNDDEDHDAPLQKVKSRGMVRQSAAFYVAPSPAKNGKKASKRALLELESDDLDANRATEEFGRPDFSDEEWVDNFFRNNLDFDAPTKCRLLENWQASIKRGLKDSVLEQYEYFVDASTEMTNMGREVAALKSMVETQNECIKEMKEIDFNEGFGGMLAMYDSDDEGMEPPHLRAGALRARRGQKSRLQDDAQSDASSISTADGQNGIASKETFDPFEIQKYIEISPELEDISEEISAFIKESRYTDATDLLLKAKSEVDEIFALHENRSEESRLSKKGHAKLTAIKSTLSNLTERMCSRLSEGLRRKNEALKQASKRERADPSNLMAPIVSPCCLDDDAVPLRLLVKLGEAKEAANAYSARRSLLLTDTLHERPISGTGNMDLVIYAAQLSQSFFSDLAFAVEGFLDLFLVASEPQGPKDEEMDSSSMLSAAQRNVPQTALASIVLWCDSELAKFSSAFGGTRILGNLALSPPPRRSSNHKRKSKKDRVEGNDAGRERSTAIEVAAQCIDQALQYASENLDSIGLPLTPRLAEYLRVRLKGCEGEVAALLDPRWKLVTYDWENYDIGDMPMDERENMVVEDD
jgi:hypothetical protein